MKTNIYPPPIYRLDKINNYIKAKLDDYLRDSKEISKGAFEKTVFMKMFFENEIEQSKILLSEVGQNNRNQNLDPYSMSFARSGYGYAKDYESIHLEKEFFKFYIISLEKHLEVLLNSLNKIQPEAVKHLEAKQQHPKHDPNLWNNDCFELFKYLYDCYYKTTNRQLTNIWFYLKESKSNKYILKATKEQYTDFIFEQYQKKITNFDKALIKWEDKECNTINEHRMNFEDSLK